MTPGSQSVSKGTATYQDHLATGLECHGRMCVTSGFDVSLNSQVKFEVLWFRACSGCPSYKYRLGH
jgi:hypothetical protein